MTAPFPHDFSDARYCKALKRLFKAGTGVAPPKLAGRDTESELAADVLLGPLADSEAPAGDLVLFGPRGNGKTVLLKKLERTAAAGIEVIALTPRALKTPAALGAVLLRPASIPDGSPAKPGLATRAGAKAIDTAERTAGQPLGVDGVSVGTPGLGTVSLGVLDSAALNVELTERLTKRCRTWPLLVTVDEAHTLDIETGADLLNLSQQLRADGVPFVLILAGTPNLEAHLGKMSATFWDRSEILPIGRLSAKATEQALTEPLGDWSVTFDPGALAAVVADSQCYPYFIQLWGRALCGALVEQGAGHTVTVSLVEQVTPEVAARRERYYGKRYQELEERELLEVAALVAGCFEKSEQVAGATLKAALCKGLGLDTKAVMAALSQLADLGYTWAPEGGREIEPGIPSLMTHVREALAEDMDSAPAWI